MELEKYLIPSYEFFGLFKNKKKNLQKGLDMKNNKPLLNSREKMDRAIELIKNEYPTIFEDEKKKMVSAYKSYMKLVMQYLKRRPFPGASIPERDPDLGIGYPDGLDITEDDIYDEALLEHDKCINIGIIDLDIYSFYGKNEIDEGMADNFMEQVDLFNRNIDRLLRDKEYIKDIYYDIEWDGGCISVDLKPSDDFIRKTQGICKRNNIKLL